LTVPSSQAAPSAVELTGSGGTRTNALGEATRSRLIAEGERLFAEQGIASVTLKEVAQAAGQRNNTAIQYHFGNKEGLLRAITVQRARVTEDSRAHMLARAASTPSGYTVENLVAAMVLPLAANLEAGDNYLRFQSRLVEERGGFQELGDDIPGAMRAIRELLDQLLRPGIPSALIRHRFDIALISIIHTLARYQRLVNGGNLESPATVLVDDLISVTSAGLTAPPATSANAAARGGFAVATHGLQP
jgi:AcrR family transcriptional regulator